MTLSVTSPTLSLCIRNWRTCESGSLLKKPALPWKVLSVDMVDQQCHFSTITTMMNSEQAHVCSPQLLASWFYRCSNRPKCPCFCHHHHRHHNFRWSLSSSLFFDHHRHRRHHNNIIIIIITINNINITVMMFFFLKCISWFCEWFHLQMFNRFLYCRIASYDTNTAFFLC